MNGKKLGSFKWLIFKYRREDQIIQPFWTIGSPQEIVLPLFNMRKFSKTDKSTSESCRMHWNLINDEKFGLFKCLILKKRMGEQIIQPFCRIGSPQQIRATDFNLSKFSKTDKSTCKSCRMHWSLMNDKEFGSYKCLILKHRRGGTKFFIHSAVLVAPKKLAQLS